MTVQQKILDSAGIEIEVKHRVLDTSAIVHDPAILLAYGFDHIYLNLSVLEELDELKDRRDKAVSQEARKAIREIEKIINGFDGDELQSGVKTPNGKGVLHVIIDTDIKLDKRVAIGKDNEVDNRLINSCLNLQKFAEGDTVLVSRDINLRLKARTLGVQSEDVPDDVAVQDLDLMWPGYVELNCDVFADIKDPNRFELQSDADGQKGPIYKLPKELFGKHAQKNLYWSDDAGQKGRIVQCNDDTVTVELFKGFMNSQAWGVVPRSMRQAVAMHQLTDESYDLNILVGPAGTGKTLLAMAAALHLVLEKKQYKRIVCVRSRDFMDDEPGYLPGDLDAKVRPLLAGVLDSLYTLHRDDESPQGSMEYIIERAKIEFTSMAYMRGRSLADSIIIIDEAQNMTKHQMRGMLSRSGPGSRTIVLGNTRQIDNPFLTPLTSGLASAVNIYRNYDKGSVIIMNEVERSPLAAFTEENF